MSTPTQKKFGGLDAFSRFLAKIKEIFVQKTDSASSTTKGVAKLYTTTGNNTDGSITQKKITEELSDKLPLSGGTLTGDIYTTPYYDSTVVSPEGGQVTIVSKGKNAKGTHPSSISETHTLVAATDSTGELGSTHKYGHVQTTVSTAGVTTTEIAAFKDVASANNLASISVSMDASGNISTSAPTPVTSDNSTKIATTAYVRNIVPTGGSSGQVLKWSSNGVAEWGDESGGGGTYTASDGITLTDHNFTNSGVRAVTAGGTNGTIVVNTNGTNETITPYTHPTTEGNKHIPSGGSSGQLLKYSAAGTAAWSTVTASDIGAAPSDINTGVMSVTESTNNGKITVDGTDVNIHGLASGAYSEAYVHPTAAGNKHIPAGGSSGNVLEWSADGTAAWGTLTASDVGAASSIHTHVKSEITDFPTIPTITDVYSGTSSDGMSGKAVKSAIDAALVSAYKPSGSIAYASLPTLSANVMGNVYNITNSFTIDNRFVEYDSSKTQTFPSGTEVAVINTGTSGSPTYKFSVMSGFIDLSNYQLTSTAVTHTASTAVGSGTKPVYINSSGIATEISYTIAKSVPADALFTDTIYTHPTSGATAGSYGPSTNITGTEGTTMSVPYITVDSNGHVTSIENKTYTSKDTTYDLMTAAEASTGTSTTARSISAKVLHDKIEEYDDEHVISDAEIIALFNIDDSSDNYY